MKFTSFVFLAATMLTTLTTMSSLAHAATDCSISTKGIQAEASQNFDGSCSYTHPMILVNGEYLALAGDINLNSETGFCFAIARSYVSSEETYSYTKTHWAQLWADGSLRGTGYDSSFSVHVIICK